MLKFTLRKLRRNKLALIAIVIALLVTSYFIYKYAYIYTERRKYDQATVAIQKVAADLRAQGIETEFSKGCSHNIEVYGAGSLNCAVGFVYKGDKRVIISPTIIKSLMKSMDANKFKISKNAIIVGEMDVSTGFSILALEGSQLPCILQYDDNKPENTNYEVFLSCSNASKYNIF